MKVLASRAVYPAARAHGVQVATSAPGHTIVIGLVVGFLARRPLAGDACECVTAPCYSEAIARAHCGSGEHAAHGAIAGRDEAQRARTARVDQAASSPLRFRKLKLTRLPPSPTMAIATVLGFPPVTHMRFEAWRDRRGALASRSIGPTVPSRPNTDRRAIWWSVSGSLATAVDTTDVEEPMVQVHSASEPSTHETWHGWSSSRSGSGSSRNTPAEPIPALLAPPGSRIRPTRTTPLRTEARSVSHSGW